MIHVQKEMDVSERRACQAINQLRSTQRYVGQRASIDSALCCRMSELSRENPRYGYRRVWTLLRRTHGGWRPSTHWDINELDRYTGSLLLADIKVEPFCRE